MLYVFHGDDVTRAKAEALKRAKGAQIVRVGENGETYANAMSFVGAQGMFAPSVALILDRPLDDDDGEALIEDSGDALVSADTLVIAIVPELSATDKKKFPKGATFEEFAHKKSASKEKGDYFALPNAFMAGDRKKAWVTYRTLIDSGSAPEMVHGGLAWAVRDRIQKLSQRHAPQKETDAMLNVSRALLALYDDARSGRGSMEDLIEIFLLKK
jgi:DNA polymerase III delta subunit